MTDGTATGPTTDGAPTETTESAGAASPSKPLGRWLLLVGTPLLLGIALWFHPVAGMDLYGDLAPIADTWLLYHVVLLVLFGLLGVCLYVLLNEYDGRVATIGRAGVAVYFVFYVAFEAIAGIATGLLVRGAQSLPAEQQAGVAEALGTMVGPILALALAGTAGTVVAVAALGFLLRRSGAPLVPVVLLASVPLTAFTHGGARVDAVGMALFLVAVVWLELGWKRNDDGRPAPTT